MIVEIEKAIRRRIARTRHPPRPAIYGHRLPVGTHLGRVGTLTGDPRFTLSGPLHSLATELMETRKPGRDDRVFAGATERQSDLGSSGRRDADLSSEIEEVRDRRARRPGDLDAMDELIGDPDIDD